MLILGLIDVPIWLLTIVGILVSAYLYSKWKLGLWKRLGVPGPPPTIFIGNLGMLKRLGLWGMDMECTKKYGKIYGIYFGGIPNITLADPELVKEYMIKKFSSFPNRFRLPGAVPKEVQGMLSNAKGEHWKLIRNTLTPTFSSGKMRMMSQSVQMCCEKLLENIKDLSHDGKDEIEMKEICGGYTMDVICSTAFGIDVNSQKDPNNVFVKQAKKAFNVNFTSSLITILLIFPFCAPLVTLIGKLSIKKLPFLEVFEFFRKVTLSVIEDRKSENEQTRKDFLQLMLNSHEDSVDNEDRSNMVDYKDGTSKKRGLTIDEVTANAFLFFVAGYDTTANTIAFLAYNLALHPDCQDKCIEEVDRVLGKEKPDYDNVLKLEYLDNCMNETLRMYGAAPVTNRLAAEDCEIGGYHIKKGTVLNFSIYGIHHDPEHWPEPEKFIPDRFLPEEKAMRHPYAFLPFGHGPRNCIGMRLAYLEIKAAIATILQSYKILRCNQTEVPVTFDLRSGIIRPKNGITLKVEKRSQE